MSIDRETAESGIAKLHFKGGEELPHARESVLAIMTHPEFTRYAKSHKRGGARRLEAMDLEAQIGGDLVNSPDHIPPTNREFQLARKIYNQLTSKR